MEGIRSQLLSILCSNGLKELNPLNEDFDPAKEESVGFIDTEKLEDEHKILQVLQKGYYFQEKLIRPAKVKIGKMVGSE
jgi:molecular chaperone GrpE